MIPEGSQQCGEWWDSFQDWVSGFPSLPPHKSTLDDLLVQSPRFKNSTLRKLQKFKARPQILTKWETSLFDLLKSVHALWVDGVSGDDHDHGQVGVDQCQRAVLQLPGQDALAAIFDIIWLILFLLVVCLGIPVQVGQLLDFECTLETSGVAVPGSQLLWKSWAKTFSKRSLSIAIRQKNVAVFIYPRPMTSSDFCWYIRLARSETCVDIFLQF